MSERIHVLAQQLFNKSSVEECDLQEIKNLVHRYPYFAPAQFLLLEKLKRENSPGYTSQLQKAVLYYQNPLEFEYFISSERFETEIEFEEEQDLEKEIIEEQLTEPGEEIPGEFAAEETIEEPAFSDPDSTEEINEEPAPMLEQEKMAESISRVLDQEEEQITEYASNDNNTDLVFEPYHTVDYFASQGIKLSQEETGTDKFGKQLKSFTEWLKTMKRIPAKEISKNIDPTSESKVQNLAENSVHEANVVTEAMAEVWIKQGNKEKAIETYNKLGLLNPSKKAYFAGLIENLKRS